MSTGQDIGNAGRWVALLLVFMAFGLWHPSVASAGTAEHALLLVYPSSRAASPDMLLPADGLSTEAFLPTAPVLPFVLYEHTARRDSPQAGGVRVSAPFLRASGRYARPSCEDLSFAVSGERPPLWCLNCVSRC